MKDYYDVLGIPRDAAPGVVKVAYEGRMKKAARLKDAERAAEERELKEAYAILSNPAKREDFDASLMEAMRKVKDTEGIPVTTQIEMAVRDWLKRRGTVVKKRTGAAR